MKVVGAAGYDLTLRERIVAAVEGGMSVKDAARQFSVNVMTVYRYLNSHRLGQLHVVAKPTSRPFQLTTVHEAQLLAGWGMVHRSEMQVGHILVSGQQPVGVFAALDV